ncbi:hypothetical protein ABMA84_15885 [Halobacteriovorax sp. XZX-2]|uniref:hypothetical protein n=1 Tax=Halobacteriovorax sp. XZX-2 TaxID=3157721 RepID=UPI003721B357
MTDLKKRTETREGKRPWEQGFQDEEFEQKQERLKEREVDPNIIKNEVLQKEDMRRRGKKE